MVYRLGGAKPAVWETLIQFHVLPQTFHSSFYEPQKRLNSSAALSGVLSQLPGPHILPCYQRLLGYKKRNEVEVTSHQWK